MNKKTHQQLHKELRDAFNAREFARKNKRMDDVAAADTLITELRGQLPSPKGTKMRWR
jgi:hypothetical protein